MHKVKIISFSNSFLNYCLLEFFLFSNLNIIRNVITPWISFVISDQYLFLGYILKYILSKLSISGWLIRACIRKREFFSQTDVMNKLLSRTEIHMTQPRRIEENCRKFYVVSYGIEYKFPKKTIIFEL